MSYQPVLSVIGCSFARRLVHLARKRFKIPGVFLLAQIDLFSKSRESAGFSEKNLYTIFYNAEGCSAAHKWIITKFLSSTKLVDRTIVDPPPSSQELLLFLEGARDAGKQRRKRRSMQGNRILPERLGDDVSSDQFGHDGVREAIVRACAPIHG